MHKDTLSAADMSIFAEIGLIIFVAVFVLIIIRALLMKKQEAEHLSALPLSDDSQPLKEVTS